MKRVLTALLLAPIVVYLVLKAPHWPFFIAVLLVAFICYREFSTIAEGHGLRLGWAGFPAGALLLLAGPGDGWLLLTLFSLLSLSLCLPLVDLAKVLPQAAASVLGLVYIFSAWKSAILLREHSPHWLMFALALSWFGDVGAYYVGRKMGRHKLLPRVSPAKSWEGSLASLLVSVAFGLIYLTRFLPEVDVTQGVLVSVFTNLAGQLGDFAESALKRGAGLKDSGGLLPGHGGLLDRVDSSLFALPVVYAFVRWRVG